MAFGILLVALGWILEGEFAGIGAAIRTLGGMLFLVGLGIVVFGDPRRRAVCDWHVGAHPVPGTCQGLRTGAGRTGWDWPALLSGPHWPRLPSFYRSSSETARWLPAPAVLLFWAGVFLLIYGRFYGRGETPGLYTFTQRGT